MKRNNTATSFLLFLFATTRSFYPGEISSSHFSNVLLVVNNITEYTSNSLQQVTYLNCSLSPLFNFLIYKPIFLIHKPLFLVPLSVTFVALGYYSYPELHFLHCGSNVTNTWAKGECSCIRHKYIFSLPPMTHTLCVCVCVCILAYTYRYKYVFSRGKKGDICTRE